MNFGRGKPSKPVAQLGLVFLASLTGFTKEKNQGILPILFDDSWAKKTIGNRGGALGNSRFLKHHRVRRRCGLERQYSRNKQAGGAPEGDRRGCFLKIRQGGLPFAQHLDKPAPQLQQSRNILRDKIAERKGGNARQDVPGQTDSTHLRFLDY